MSVPKRVVILGTSSSGKTTLAKKIAEEQGIQRIELDQLYWQPNWVPTPMPEFLQKIEKELNSYESWVICGNYNVAKNLTLPRATHIIWLNYPLRINLWRGFKRSVKRIIRNENSFEGCKESFTLTFLSKKSILLWIWQTHKSRREVFSKLLTPQNFKQAAIMIVRNENDLRQIKL